MTEREALMYLALRLLEASDRADDVDHVADDDELLTLITDTVAIVREWRSDFYDGDPRGVQ